MHLKGKQDTLFMKTLLALPLLQKPKRWGDIYNIQSQIK
jgi:hypothetical protein